MRFIALLWDAQRECVLCELHSVTQRLGGRFWMAKPSGQQKARFQLQTKKLTLNAEYWQWTAGTLQINTKSFGLQNHHSQANLLEALNSQWFRFGRVLIENKSVETNWWQV